MTRSDRDALLELRRSRERTRQGHSFAYRSGQSDGSWVVVLLGKAFGIYLQLNPGPRVNLTEQQAATLQARINAELKRRGLYRDQD